MASSAAPRGPAVASSPSSWSDLVRPVLRPGLRVVRRDDRHLQLGLDPPERLVLPDRPGLRRALSRLECRPPEELREVVDQLVHEGWVVDAAARADDIPARQRHVAVTADPMLEHSVLRACSAARLEATPAAPLRLVVTTGEPPRALSDSLVRDDEPHLWLAVLPGSVRIGPYVEPGRTACLRCLDAHLGDLDPRRAMVLHQLEELPATSAADPEPCLLQLAVAWAVRDVARLLAGRPSALRSTTVTVSEDLVMTQREWLRHPHCGCAWG